MTHPFAVDSVHHFALTVTDVSRSVAFYTEHLGFEILAPFGDRMLLRSGNLVIALTPPSDAGQAIPDDSFNENRVGLDHISFDIGSRAALESAAAYFDANGIERAELNELEPFGICVMVVRDPDNIQLELTAPLSDS